MSELLQTAIGLLAQLQGEHVTLTTDQIRAMRNDLIINSAGAPPEIKATVHRIVKVLDKYLDNDA